MRQDIIDRFWGKVEKTAACWNWVGGKTSDGYGAWTYPTETRQQFIRAHRFAFLVINKKFLKPELHHECRNKLCVRPAPGHVIEVTRKEHMRQTPGSYGYRWAHATHCLRGHLLEGRNLLPSGLKRGTRMCRQCRIDSNRKWRAENPEKMRKAVERYKENNLEKVRAKDREYHKRYRLELSKSY